MSNALDTHEAYHQCNLSLSSFRLGSKSPNFVQGLQNIQQEACKPLTLDDQLQLYVETRPPMIF